ncbi:MAG TPA: DUF4249 domain-containing protein [Cytophagaceae bacterium]
MKIINAYIFLALLFTITSCISNVKDADLPSPETQLVLTSFISPQDEVIYVYIGKTKAIYGNEVSHSNDTIKDATIYIHDQNDTLWLYYYPGTQYYKAEVNSFKIEEGKTYYLKASTTDGLYAEASCTIPKAYDLEFNISVDSFKNSYNDSYTYTLNMDWQDPAGIKNYYRVSPHLVIITERNYGYPYNYTSSDTSYHEFYFYWLENYISDSGKDGNKITVTNGKTPSPYNPNVNTYSHYCGVKVIMFFTDENYYKYNTSVYKFDGENPFSEPVLVHSNIKNGFGTFAGYNKIEKLVLKQ